MVSLPNPNRLASERVVQCVPPSPGTVESPTSKT